MFKSFALDRNILHKKYKDKCTMNVIPLPLGIK